MGSAPEDENQFAEIVRPHLDRLYRLAYRLTGAQSDAEDLLQEVLAKLYERRTELTSVSEPGPWLARILYNRFIDDTRKQARSRLSVVDPKTLEATGLGGLAAGADAEVESEFTIMELESALAKLSIEHRSVLLMHDAEGYKLHEIHVITGISLGTLKSRLHRARARLRELLRKDGTFLDRAAC